MVSKFYHNLEGRNIIQDKDIELFLTQNQELAHIVSEHPIELHPIDLDEFQTMTFWIMGQIISNNIAHRMINNFRKVYPGITPKSVLVLGFNGLIKFVPSKIKCQTILNLAEFFEQGNYIDPTDHSSSEIVKHYSQVKGVGPWTVKMLLIYNYGRLDISAIEDLGVRQGLKILYNTPTVPSISEARKLTKAWANLGTLGSLLSWLVIKDS